MNPVPLTDPSGTVRAWMCGNCRYVAQLPERLATTVLDEDVQATREHAARCCLCTGCGVPSTRVRDCEPCSTAAWAALYRAYAEDVNQPEIEEISTACTTCGCDGHCGREQVSA